MKKFAQKHPIGLFFLVTYALAWAIWIPAVYVWRRWFAPDVFPWWFMGAAVVGGYIPAIAAIIMAGLLQGRSGIARLLQKLLVWRVGFRWYMAALGIPAAGILLAIGIFALSGGTVGRVDLSQWYMIFFIPLLLLPMGVVGEELGWRGYALPALQWHYSALKSSSILGVLWALWHAPAYWAPSGTIISGRPVTPAAIAFFVAFGVGTSIIMTWIYNNTNDNVPLAILFHLSMNAGFPFLFFPDLTSEAKVNTIYLCMIPIWIVSVLFIKFYGAKNLSRQAIKHDEMPGLLRESAS